MKRTGLLASGARSRLWGTAIAATLLLCLNSPVLAKDHPGKGVGLQVQAAPQVDKQALKDLRTQQHAAAKAERTAARQVAKAQQQAARAVTTQPSAKAQRQAAKAQQKAAKAASKQERRPTPAPASRPRASGQATTTAAAPIAVSPTP